MSTTTNDVLKRMAETTDTDYWNDSCSIQELEYAIANGAVGATTNPVIVFNVLEKELHLWQERILDIIRENPAFDEDQVAWQLIEEMAVKGASLLEPVFKGEKGLKGRISIQTNAKFYRDASRMVDQAERFSKLAPNMQIKIPVTAAGVEALEEATYRGVNVNATLCFSVPQAIAVAEAVERGLNRREKEGKETATMTPVCTIMVGRVDDWLKVVANNRNICVNPAYLDLAGVAVMKNAARIFRERKFRSRLLAAAYRSWNHVADLMGDNIIHTIPYTWQLRYNASEMQVKDTTATPLNPEIIDTLKRNFPDFIRAYEPDSMTIDEFDNFGPTRRTLRQFIGGYDSLLKIIRDLMIPDPDIE